MAEVQVFPSLRAADASIIFSKTTGMAIRVITLSSDQCPPVTV